MPESMIDPTNLAAGTRLQLPGSEKHLVSMIGLFDAAASQRLYQVRIEDHSDPTLIGFASLVDIDTLIRAKRVD